MNFQLSALAETTFQDLFSLSETALKEHNIISELVTVKPGVPCRISLEDAEIGERVLLINYRHLPDVSPFQASHAIYIREHVKQATPQKNQIPEMITDRIISLRAFDDKRRIGTMIWQDFSGHISKQLFYMLHRIPLELRNQWLNVFSGGYKTPQYIQIWPASHHSLF